MKRCLLILDAGGYGRAVTDVAAQTGNYDEIHFLDDSSQMADVIGECANLAASADEQTVFYPVFGNNEGCVS